MLKNKNLLAASLIIGLTACSSWNPNLGMTASDFDSMCFKSGLSYKSSIVQAEGDREVRVCGAARYYYFNNGRLVKIDQGELPQQRIKIEVNK